MKESAKLGFERALVPSAGVIESGIDHDQAASRRSAGWSITMLGRG